MSRNLNYPKIPDSRDFPLKTCIAFEKYDGTNTHFRWHRDFGWHAFGTRRDEFNWDEIGQRQFMDRHPHLHELSAVFAESVMSPFETVFLHDERCTSATEFTLFAEFLGSQSFAGLHKSDNIKRLVVFDVECDNQLMNPVEFVDLFENLPIARVVYRGRFTGTFADDVRTGKYGVDEGVICKTGTRGNIQMAKIKTHAYLEKLKKAFGDRWEEYWE